MKKIISIIMASAMFSISCIAPLHNSLTVMGAENKLGDVNGDNAVDATDASTILSIYATISTGGMPTTDISRADVNGDGMIDASDASSVLAYYAYLSTGGTINDIKEWLSSPESITSPVQNSDKLAYAVNGISFYSDINTVKSKMKGYSLSSESKHVSPGGMLQTLLVYDNVELYGEKWELTFCFTKSGLVGFNYRIPCKSDNSEVYNKWLNKITDIYGQPDENDLSTSWTNSPLGSDTSIYIYNWGEKIQLSFFAEEDATLIEANIVTKHAETQGFTSYLYVLGDFKYVKVAECYKTYKTEYKTFYKSDFADYPYCVQLFSYSAFGPDRPYIEVIPYDSYGKAGETIICELPSDPA